jgi:zinc/manganese transport system substrate-binding protein
MRLRTATLLLSLCLAALVATMLAGCGAAGSGSTGASGEGKIVAVGAENQYADVIAQVGGRYVSVSSVESNPNTDPHSFEASPSVARTVGEARLVVQNGLGYDTYMQRIESAAPDSARRVIEAQKLLGLPDSTSNPHLWYSPRTMPAVADAVASDLSALQPGHAAYFRAGARRFKASLAPWLSALARLRRSDPGVAVATTEPVGDYMLEAAGARILTPKGLQADVMNGVDPAPQDVSTQEGLLSHGRVKAFLYNRQVTDSLTESFLQKAREGHVPIVGLYETMPTPGYDYQSWMTAETEALGRAIATGRSTETL